MAEDISFSSWARQASSARNQNSAIGSSTVAITATSIGLESPPADASMAQAKMAPIDEPYGGGAAPPPWNGRLDGFCCSEKIRPPMEGASSLAAIFGRAGPAGRRLAGRRPPRSAPLSALLELAIAGLQGAETTHGKRRQGPPPHRRGPQRRHRRLGPLARAGAQRALGGLALRLAVVSHSPFQFRRAGAEPLSPDTYRISPPRHRPASAESW